MHTTVTVDHGAGPEPTEWDVVELKTARDLVQEGIRLSHCVYGYLDEVQRGRTAIFSIRRHQQRQRRATIEVSVARRAVLQARGKANRDLTLAERSVLAEFCEANRLELRL